MSKVLEGAKTLKQREALIAELDRCKALMQARHVKTYEAMDILTRLTRVVEILISGEALTPERDTHHV